MKNFKELIRIITIAFFVYVYEIGQSIAFHSMISETCNYMEGEEISSRMLQKWLRTFQRLDYKILMMKSIKYEELYKSTVLIMSQLQGNQKQTKKIT